MEAVERIAWYSIAVNITVAALDAGMAYFSGSLTLAAETVHNLVDVTASVAVLIGLRLSQRKSKSFPYGLYKVENIVAVIIALSVFFTSYEIIKEAAFGSGREVVVLPIMFVGVVLAAIIPFGFGQYELRVGRLLNSPSLVASGREFQVHLLSSGVVFAALVGQTLGWPLDRVMAVAIAVLVAWTGWKLLVDGMRVLLDASLDPAILNQIREIIKGEPGVGDVNAIRGRSAGRYRFVEAEVTLKVPELEKAHAISDRIEDKIRDHVPYVERVIIHYEPVVRSQIIYAVPMRDLAGTVNEEFGTAPYFGLVTVRTSDKELEKIEVLANPHANLQKGRGIHVAEWLVTRNVDIVFVKEDLSDKGPSFVLSNAGVQFRKVSGKTLDEVLEADLSFIRNRE